MTKKKNSNYKQTDILSALNNKDEFVLDETDEVEEKEKTLTPFDFINDIKIYKKGDLLNKESNTKYFNKYMIIKGLAMDNDVVQLVNIANQYCTVLSEKQMYDLLLNIIPQTKFSRFKWIKSKDDIYKGYYQYICKYFECSEKEAFEYISIMGEEWANLIKDSYGEPTND